ncbi:MAG: iron complex transport system substrate-binding protein [Cryomorphaceae bacterium]|jgi:iron complex transport system substrate-binding protein
MNLNKLCLSLVVGLCLVGCEQHQQNPSNDSISKQIIVTDFTGKQVQLAQPAQKIVALAPHVVENIFSAGAGDQLVGVFEWSNYPEQAKSIEIVGGYEKTNYEKIIELNPDLIIAWETGNSSSSVGRLTQLGFTIYIDQPNNLEDIAKSIRDIGTLSGHSKIANSVANNYLQELAKYKFAYRDAVKVTTFYQVWNSPLQSINGSHIISDVIETCGGTNIYADEYAVAPIINIESILERNPKAIIASGVSDARPEWLDEWLQWPSLTAVQQGNLFFVNPDHLQRHTVRLLLGIQKTCRQLDLARAKIN